MYGVLWCGIKSYNIVCSVYSRIHLAFLPSACSPLFSLFPFSEMTRQDLIDHIMLVTFLCGIVTVVLGALRIGTIVSNFLSHCVITGFTSAAAIIIGFGQVCCVMYGMRCSMLCTCVVNMKGYGRGRCARVVESVFCMHC